MRKDIKPEEVKSQKNRRKKYNPENSFQNHIRISTSFHSSPTRHTISGG